MLAPHLHPLLPRRVFYWKVARNGAIALSVLLSCLGIGMIGYHHFEAMSWLDAFLNASMILSGMGPVDRPKTDGGELFAGCYALFSGVMFLTTVGIFLAPIATRIAHRLHLMAANINDKS